MVCDSFAVSVLSLVQSQFGLVYKLGIYGI